MATHILIIVDIKYLLLLYSLYKLFIKISRLFAKFFQRIFVIIILVHLLFRENFDKHLNSYDIMLCNPPFGTKKGGERATRDDLTYETSNKQLNFLQ